MAIELRLIRHAIAVGQHGNFARAAEALHLTQPSLSRSIAALEDALGVPLFDRTPKGVTPTAFGRVLLERGEIVLRREADLRREIALLAGLETGTLVVSAAPYMNETLIARAIGRIAAAHPRLRIDCRSLHPSEVVRQVLAEEADLGRGQHLRPGSRRAHRGRAAAVAARLPGLPQRPPADAHGEPDAGAGAAVSAGDDAAARRAGGAGRQRRPARSPAATASATTTCRRCWSTAWRWPA